MILAVSSIVPRGGAFNEHHRVGGVILAAIDVGNTDGEHRHLHASIIDHGYDIASLAKAHLHVISAHPSPMLSAADPTFQLRETIRPATASSARRSRPNSTSMMITCTSKKARRTC